MEQGARHRTAPSDVPRTVLDLLGVRERVGWEQGDLHALLYKVFLKPTGQFACDCGIHPLVVQHEQQPSLR